VEWSGVEWSGGGGGGGVAWEKVLERKKEGTRLEKRRYKEKERERFLIERERF
jgi:hypothetical protein